METRDVTFVLTSDDCPRLTDGTVINGAGTETSITTEGTDREGITTISNRTRTTGTATDQDGNLYQFFHLITSVLEHARDARRVSA